MEIDYDRIKYATHRALENEKKEQKGELKMFSYDHIIFHYWMKCPFCGQEQESKTRFEKRPYRLVCVSCGKKILVAKMLPR